MNKIDALSTKNAIILYIVVDIICVGAGMGVPIFCILLGFPLGWYITRRAYASSPDRHSVYAKIMRSSLLATLFTFAMMAAIWGKMLPMLFNPGTDFSNFGHPLILYEPKASFIAWLALMVLISPFLQLLATIFASFIALMRKPAPAGQQVLQ